MPRVPQPERLSFFMYRNEADAERDALSGATGFIVSIPYEKHIFGDGRQHHYVVTCEHVVNKFEKADCVGSLTVRLHKDGGGFYTTTLPFAEWVLDIPNDIAVCPIDLQGSKVDVTTFLYDSLVTDSIAEAGDIGLGDDLFMIGRFVDHPSIKANEPVARFGSIARVVKDDQGDVTMYFGDMHSRTGYSGSPVIVFRTPGSNLKKLHEDHHIVNAQDGVLTDTFVCLLGVHKGSFPEIWAIEQKTETDKWDEIKTLRARGMSGMSMITPARYLYDLIMYDEDLVMRRKEKEENENPDGAPPVNLEELGGAPFTDDDMKRDDVLKTMLKTPPKPKGKE